MMENKDHLYSVFDLRDLTGESTVLSKYIPPLSQIRVDLSFSPPSGDG
jgi:hypothetical protein